MSKAISIIVIALVIIGGAYWFMNMKGGYAPLPETTQSEKQATPDSFFFTTNGPLGVASDANGQYLTDKTGFTLYTNTQDERTDGKIVPSCNLSCEGNWLPYLLGPTEAAPGKSTDSLLSKLNLFTRADTRIQYALGTKPLYRYVNDKRPGDMTGIGISTWVVARP